jgi:hypothetical protein
MTKLFDFGVKRKIEIGGADAVIGDSVLTSPTLGNLTAQAGLDTAFDFSSSCLTTGAALGNDTTYNGSCLFDNGKKLDAGLTTWTLFDVATDVAGTKLDSLVPLAYGETTLAGKNKSDLAAHLSTVEIGTLDGTNEMEGRGGFTRQMKFDVVLGWDKFMSVLGTACGSMKTSGQAPRPDRPWTGMEKSVVGAGATVWIGSAANLGKGWQAVWWPLITDVKLPFEIGMSLVESVPTDPPATDRAFSVSLDDVLCADSNIRLASGGWKQDSAKPSSSRFLELSDAGTLQLLCVAGAGKRSGNTVLDNNRDESSLLLTVTLEEPTLLAAASMELELTAVWKFGILNPCAEFKNGTVNKTTDGATWGNEDCGTEFSDANGWQWEVRALQAGEVTCVDDNEGALKIKLSILRADKGPVHASDNMPLVPPTVWLDKTGQDWQLDKADVVHCVCSEHWSSVEASDVTFSGRNAETMREVSISLSSTTNGKLCKRSLDVTAVGWSFILAFVVSCWLRSLLGCTRHRSLSAGEHLKYTYATFVSLLTSTGHVLRFMTPSRLSVNNRVKKKKEKVRHDSLTGNKYQSHVFWKSPKIGNRFILEMACTVTKNGCGSNCNKPNFWSVRTETSAQ